MFTVPTIPRQPGPWTVVPVHTLDPDSSFLPLTTCTTHPVWESTGWGWGVGVVDTFPCPKTAGSRFQEDQIFSPVRWSGTPTKV